MSKHKQIEELKAQIARHNKLYYEESSPEISDEEYDQLTKKLRNLLDEGTQEDLFTLGLTQTKFQKIKHAHPMLSLGNVFNREELEDFIKRVNNFLNTDAQIYEFTAEKKIDGLSFSATFENGKLLYILTRGDGETGENITENVLTIPNFPTQIEITEKVEIRGEIYMLHQDFEELNIANKKNGEKVFANPRNAASGSIRQLDSSVTKSRKLQYFVYSMVGNLQEIGIKMQSELYQKLQENSFKTNDYTVCNAVEEMIAYYESVEKIRFSLGFDIDGIVYKINSIPMQERLGTTSNAPRWAIAHKFSAKTGETKVEEIILQVGRTGIITPVANLSPINLGGVVVKRATLHNKDEIFRLGINIGDIIAIERAGDVIPKITAVTTKTSTGIFDFPKNCPCCGEELSQIDTLIRCQNFTHCRDQIIGRLQYFVSKDCFNIIGLGEKQIEEFYNRGIIKSFSDIFTLPQKIDAISLHTWEGWGMLSIQNLVESINKSKVISLEKFITALGIYTIGTENAKILAGFFKKAANMLQPVTEEMLTSLDGIGTKTAKEVIHYLQKNESEIQKLIQEIAITDYTEENNNGSILFTGTLSISRQEAKSLAQKAGFVVSSSINKNLNFLVAGEEAGSKLPKAKELGIKILNEAEFFTIIKT
jgi:DNA ligase (NAD+)